MSSTEPEAQGKGLRRHRLLKGQPPPQTNAHWNGPCFNMMTHGCLLPPNRWTPRIALCTESCLQPEPSEETQGCQHRHLGQKAGISRRGKGEKRKRKKQLLPLLHLHSSTPPHPPHPSSQQNCLIRSSLLKMKGTCVHPLSREGIRQEPKQTLLHYEVLRHTNSKKTVSK